MRYLLLLTVAIVCAPVNRAAAQELPKLTLEVEGGPVWQTRNDVQIPNSAAGTRFSLVDVAGRGPVPSARLYVTWHVGGRHSLRALLAPFQYTQTGTAATSINFAGQSYQSDASLDATYKFNSWRLGYRYRFVDREQLTLLVGFTAKLRDAKIELSQGASTSKDTDLGFVPLLNLGANWRFAPQWSFLLDADGLAGGPGRAFDVAAKLSYDIDSRWSIRAGYRTVEGGADVESVYNFAWLHYAVVSAAYRI